MFTFLMVIIGATFVLSPIWGSIARTAYARLDGHNRRFLIGTQAALGGIGLVIVISSWSFSGVVVDAVVLSLAYLSYSGLTFIICGRRPRWLTWFLAGIAIIPTAIALLVTLSLLGLMFVAGDFKPTTTGSLGDGYTYRTHRFGNALGQAHYTEVEILHQPKWFPFVEHEIFNKSFDYESYEYSSVTVTRTGQNIVVQHPQRDGRVERAVVNLE